MRIPPSFLGSSWASSIREAITCYPIGCHPRDVVVPFNSSFCYPIANIFAYLIDFLYLSLPILLTIFLIQSFAKPRRPFSFNFVLLILHMRLKPVWPSNENSTIFPWVFLGFFHSGCYHLLYALSICFPSSRCGHFSLLFFLLPSSNFCTFIYSRMS